MAGTNTRPRHRRVAEPSGPAERAFVVHCPRCEETFWHVGCERPKDQECSQCSRVQAVRLAFRIHAMIDIARQTLRGAIPTLDEVTHGLLEQALAILDEYQYDDDDDELPTLRERVENGTAGRPDLASVKGMLDSVVGVSGGSNDAEMVHQRETQSAVARLAKHDDADGLCIRPKICESDINIPEELVLVITDRQVEVEMTRLAAQGFPSIESAWDALKTLTSQSTPNHWTENRAHATDQELLRRARL